MNKFLTPNFVISVLFISLMTNALGWAFQGEVFIHELEHSSCFNTQNVQKDFHNNFTIEDESSNKSNHICLNGVYQPFYFSNSTLLPAILGKEIQTVMLFPKVWKFFLDTPYRPPRSFILS